MLRVSTVTGIKKRLLSDSESLQNLNQVEPYRLPTSRLLNQVISFHTNTNEAFDYPSENTKGNCYQSHSHWRS